jgi:peptidoglycan/LPS O-acetylase OafA/YrhL
VAAGAEAGSVVRRLEATPTDLATELGRNPAFDGLRLVAVAAVIAAHFAIPGGEAGFLGVDIFFVLSGFLITGILLGQVERGAVDLGRFWARRVRRLAPALILVLLAIVLWGAVFAPSTTRDTLRGDITGTLLYVANWHFIGGASTYFPPPRDPSVLLHMWSLAVEEQFYVIWPVVLFLVAVFVRGRARLPLVGGVAVAGIIFSAVRLYTVWGPGHIDRAYMGTDSRMFEPLLGAALAVLLVWRPKLGSSQLANAALVLFGVVILAIGFSKLGNAAGPTRLYPNGGAFVFSLGTAALIWAVATRTSAASSVLSLPPVAYLGRISYGIYLWHWPLICWVNSHQLGLGRLATVSLGLRVYILVILTVVLAALSYHLVEKPIRYGAIGARLRGIRIAVALPAAIAVLLALNLTQVVVHAGAAIRISDPGRGGAPVQVTKTIVLVGDSVTAYFAPELADAAAKYGYTVVSAAHPGCPASGLVYPASWPYRRTLCQDVAHIQDAAIRQYHPALVIWWSRYEVTSRYNPHTKELLIPGTPAYERQQQAAFAARVASLTRFGARVVAVQIEHPGLMARTQKSGHLSPVMLQHWGVVRNWNAFLGSHDGPGVFSIAINDTVCHMLYPDNACDDTLPDGNSARPTDGMHYAADAGPEVAPVMIERALSAAGLPPFG